MNVRSIGDSVEGGSQRTGFVGQLFLVGHFNESARTAHPRFPVFAVHSLIVP